MTESENRTAAEAEIVGPLRRSLTPVRVAFILFSFVAWASAGLFLYQLQSVDEYGELFRWQRGAWPHLFAHVLRCLVFAIWARSLWKYQRAVTALIGANAPTSSELFNVLTAWWKRLAIGIAVLLAYGAGIAIVVGPPQSGEVAFNGLEESPAASGPGVSVEFRLAEFDPRTGFSERYRTFDGMPVYLQPEPFVTNADIASARLTSNEAGDPAIAVMFTDAAAPRIFQSTSKHLGAPVAILVDGEVISTPKVTQGFRDAAWIEEIYDWDEARRIVRGLNGITAAEWD